MQKGADGKMIRARVSWLVTAIVMTLFAIDGVAGIIFVHATEHFSPPMPVWEHPGTYLLLGSPIVALPAAIGAWCKWLRTR